MDGVTLAYYLVIGGSVLALGLALGSVRQAQPTLRGPAEVYDPLEAAFLSGGPGRVVDSAIAGLHEDGRLRIAGPGIVAVVRPEARNQVEAAVFDVHAAAPNGALHTLRIGVMRRGAVQSIGEGLAQRGLMVRPGSSGTVPGWAAGLFALSFLSLPLAVVLTALQYADDTDLADELPLIAKVFPAILLGFISSIVIAVKAKRRITPAGRSALRRYRSAYGHHPSAVLRVALAGINGIHDAELRAQLGPAARQRLHPSALSDAAVHAAGDAAGAGAEVVWCGGGCGGSSCGGSSCGSSSGGSGDSGGSSCGSSGGSSCGGGSSSSCGGGSSCGSSS
ncbi:TIGR04222 domain-containing membrane protein [Streptomyces sp. NBC_01304]|uniref:TIGR04222 domain-containing membrane protein n=1 Tax=Streptomyces sp. NBC_01304 TaxID=2903818 RepID=UPI002E0E3E8E|nr:TIGR04222 domain-containing membrane protein [Streptomyces sp. NBC_01304]